MSSERKRRPTIDDVAAAANVSRGTVSRVLGGGHWVSPKAEAAVRDAIVAVGYHPNSAAQRLASSKARAIALLVTEPDEQTFAGTSFAEMTRVLSDELGKRGLSLLLHLASTPTECKLALDFVRSGSVDGVLLLAIHDTHKSLVKDLARSGYPVVSFGAPPRMNSVKLGYVTSDNEGGASAAVHYLKQSGRSQIVFLAGPADHASARERLAGYQRELGNDFDPAMVVNAGYSTREGYTAMARWLGGSSHLDGVFAVNDATAVGAIQAIRESGRSVPGDVAVVGFDDAPLAARSDPPLTTVHQSIDRVARAMVKVILDATDGSDPANLTIPTHLVVRESA